MKSEREAEASGILDSRLRQFREALEEALKSLGAPIVLKDAAGPPHPFDALVAARDLAEMAGQASSQRDLLRAALDSAHRFFPRVVLFIRRGDTLHGWEGRGLEPSADSAALPSRLALPASGDHLPALALEIESLQSAGPGGPGAELVEALGGAMPARATAFPILIHGRGVAVLYGDGPVSVPSESDAALELCARLAGLGLQILALTRRPTVSSVSVQAVAAATREHPAVSSPTATSGRPAPRPTPTPPEESELHALLGDIDGAPRRDGEEASATPDEQRQIADARRFASLLVSELLLYNEESVIQGRRHHDLGRRLAKEIEKSRRAYSARVSQSLKGASRYLDEELVRVLAEGDRSLLSA